MRIVTTLFALVLLIASAPAALADTSYGLDVAHTNVGFSVRHMVVSNVHGRFKEFKGGFTLNDKNVLTGVNATIMIASIDTENQKRDDHLRSADFFDAKKFPTMTFKSTKVKNDGADYKVTGDLTIKGVTKSVTLKGEMLGTVVDPWGNKRAGFTATGKINRKDFGVNFHKVLEAGGLVVGDEVKIILDIEGIAAKK